MWILRTFFLMVILSGLLIGCGQSFRQDGWSEELVEHEYSVCRSRNYLNEDATQNMKACKCWVNQMSQSYTYAQSVQDQQTSQSVLRSCFVQAGVIF